jgi:hypothetical protein
MLKTKYTHKNIIKSLLPATALTPDSLFKDLHHNQQGKFLVNKVTTVNIAINHLIQHESSN